MTEILNFVTTVPTPVTNGVSIPIPTSPAGVGVAHVNVNVSRGPNRVELTASIGIQGFSLFSNVLFRVLRGTQTIGYFLKSVSPFFDPFQVVTIEFVDQNAPLGFQDYTIAVENQNGANGGTAFVIGPISFSALVIGL
ncbi:MAG: hypothetical protein K0R57_682 [Paenibacillaceae bacterium]|jgi:hypothetical protein|nr:hypothetical protein [Paenibacillaceae bacterium]